MPPSNFRIIMNVDRSDDESTQTLEPLQSDEDGRTAASGSSHYTLADKLELIKQWSTLDQQMHEKHFLYNSSKKKQLEERYWRELTDRYNENTKNTRNTSGLQQKWKALRKFYQETAAKLGTSGSDGVIPQPEVYEALQKALAKDATINPPSTYSSISGRIVFNSNASAEASGSRSGNGMSASGSGSNEQSQQQPQQSQHHQSSQQQETNDEGQPPKKKRVTVAELKKNQLLSQREKFVSSFTSIADSLSKPLEETEEQKDYNSKRSQFLDEQREALKEKRETQASLSALIQKMNEKLDNQ